MCVIVLLCYVPWNRVESCLVCANGRGACVQQLHHRDASNQSTSGSVVVGCCPCASLPGERFRTAEGPRSRTPRSHYTTRTYTHTHKIHINGRFAAVSLMIGSRSLGRLDRMTASPLLHDDPLLGGSQHWQNPRDFHAYAAAQQAGSGVTGSAGATTEAVLALGRLGLGEDSVERLVILADALSGTRTAATSIPHTATRSGRGLGSSSPSRTGECACVGCAGRGWGCLTLRAACWCFRCSHVQFTPPCSNSRGSSP